MRKTGIGRFGSTLLVVILVTSQAVALAQFGGFGLPFGGQAGDQGEAAAPGAEGGQDGCPDMEHIGQLPPAARKVAGEAAQAGNSTFVMMTQGREILGRSMEETGDTAQALRQIRDEAAFRSLECSSDKDYRLGVCQTFTLQCLAHGGGGCDSCGRRWGNLFCKETLKKTVKDTVPKPEDVFGEGSDWPELIGLAEQVAGTTLVDDLNEFRQDVLNGAVDGPVDELCDGYFYPQA
jgi:hypothetical protein